MSLNPRHLVLNMLIATDGAPLSAREAVASSALFGIRENSVRVALVRLAADGLIEAEARGTYRLGPKAAELAQDVRGWRTAESRVRKWNGRWLGVHAGALGRSDRAALRRRQRALQLLGFRELCRGLELRPDNIAGGAAEVRGRLYRLGLEPEAAVFSLSNLDVEREAKARALWNGKVLTQGYVRSRERLEKWLSRAKELDLVVAAREAFLIGNDAIRSFIYDPLLPEPLVDEDKRHAFVETLLAFDRAGHAIWRELRATGAEQKYDAPTH